jgi:hypothetical protein
VSCMNLSGGKCIAVLYGANILYFCSSELAVAEQDVGDALQFHTRGRHDYAGADQR